MLGNWFRRFCVTTTNSWKPLETFRRNVHYYASVHLLFIYLYIYKYLLHVIYVRLLHMSVLPVCSWTSVTAVSTVSAQSLCVFALCVDVVLLFFVSLSCFLCPGFGLKSLVLFFSLMSAHLAEGWGGGVPFFRIRHLILYIFLLSKPGGSRPSEAESTSSANQKTVVAWP